MRKRTKRICQVCGKSFFGSGDCYYCPECVKAKKLDAVVKIRICQDCGVEFYGGPRARRCPDCAYKAQQETSIRWKRQGTKRVIGSIDKCQWCGAEYTVVCGRQKYCSKKCQREAVLAWQREHKKDYNKTSKQEVKKTERRKQVKKVCVYCGRIFTSDKPTNLCSEYCKNEQKKLSQCKSDIKRGRNRNIQKYLDKREKYREKQKMNERKESELEGKKAVDNVIDPANVVQ